MIILDLDGNEVKWNFSKFYDRKFRTGKSQYHTLARDILKECFPNHTIYEEVSLPLKPVLYADFFIPSLLIMVEIHGEQHYSFNPHFHKSKLDYYQSKARDRKKIEWCELNNIKHIALSYKDKKIWMEQIMNSK